jgi:HK97 family phage portal protein
MPVLTKVMNRFGLTPHASRKEEPVINDGDRNAPSIIVRTGMSAAQWTGWEYHDYPQRAAQGYQKNSDVYACVSLIAQAGKQVKWWDDSETGSAALTRLDVLAKDVGVDPNTNAYKLAPERAVSPRKSIELLIRSGGQAFIEQWLSFMLLAGNAYKELIRTRGDISMVYLDNPAYVSAEPNRNAEREQNAVAYWVVRSPYGSTRRRVEPYKGLREGELIHSKLFHPTDPIYGMAPLEAAMLRVDAQNEGTTLMKRVLQRGFAPGWIEAREDSDWTEEQVGALKSNIRRSKQVGEELFLQNAKWHEMGFRPAESGVSEQQALTKRDIASVFHVDPALIGDTSTRTYATYHESRQALYMEAVIPLLTQFKAEWNRTIGAELMSPLDFDKDSFDAITQARQEATDRVTKLWGTGLITRDEGRADLEYDPAQPGDVFYAPANIVPMLEDAGGDEE